MEIQLENLGLRLVRREGHGFAKNLSSPLWYSAPMSIIRIAMIFAFGALLARGGFAQPVELERGVLVGNQSGCTQLGTTASIFDGLQWHNFEAPSMDPSFEIVLDSSVMAAPNVTNQLVLGEFTPALGVPCAPEPIAGGDVTVGDLDVVQGSFSIRLDGNTFRTPDVTFSSASTNIGLPRFPEQTLTAPARLTIQGPGTFVEQSALFVGLNSELGGQVTIRGADFQGLSNPFQPFIEPQAVLLGGDGDGVLEIIEGSTAQLGEVYVGGFGSGNGTLLVDASSVVSAPLEDEFFSFYEIGSESEGELTIRNGGTVESTYASLGLLGGTATATIEGAGSSWTVEEEITVGNELSDPTGNEVFLHARLGGRVRTQDLLLFEGARVETGATGRVDVGTPDGDTTQGRVRVFEDGQFIGAGQVDSDLVIDGFLQVIDDPMSGRTEAGLLRVNELEFSETALLLVDTEFSAKPSDTLLMVTDGVTLAGGLQVLLGDGDVGYVPATGDEIVLVEADAIAGGFTWVEVSAIPAGLVWALLERDGEEGARRQLALTFAAEGDLNFDGSIDAADYTVWRDNLGTEGVVPFSRGDGDGDGVVTTADYEVWRSGFGAAPAGDPVVAPEPPAVLLMLLAASLGCAGRRGDHPLSGWLGSRLGLPSSPQLVVNVR